MNPIFAGVVVGFFSAFGLRVFDMGENLVKGMVKKWSNTSILKRIGLFFFGTFVMTAGCFIILFPLANVLHTYNVKFLSSYTFASFIGNFTACLLVSFYFLIRYKD